MLKNLYSALCVIAAAICFSPLNLIKDDVTVTSGGKSAGQFLTVSKENFSEFINADGVSFSVTESTLKTILEKTACERTHSFYDGEILNVYYYSERIPVKEVISNKRVNVHVAISDNGIKVGIPFIYYGY